MLPPFWIVGEHEIWTLFGIVNTDYGLSLSMIKFEVVEEFRGHVLLIGDV